MTDIEKDIDDNLRVLAELKVNSMKAVDGIDTTDTFKKRLRERIAAGEYALRKALEDLQHSLAVSRNEAGAETGEGP